MEEPQQFDNLVDIKLNSPKLQPMRLYSKHRTAFLISGKIRTKKGVDEKGKECIYIDTIDFNYSRVNGLINFTINRINSIKEETITANGPMFNKKAIVIRLELRAFNNDNDNYTHTLQENVEIGINSILHLNISDDIADLNKEDDISDNENYDQIDICFNKVTSIL